MITQWSATNKVPAAKKPVKNSQMIYLIYKDQQCTFIAGMNAQLSEHSRFNQWRRMLPVPNTQKFTKSNQLKCRPVIFKKNLINL